MAHMWPRTLYCGWVVGIIIGMLQCWWSVGSESQSVGQVFTLGMMVFSSFFPVVVGKTRPSTFCVFILVHVRLRVVEIEMECCWRNI